MRYLFNFFLLLLPAIAFAEEKKREVEVLVNPLGTTDIRIVIGNVIKGLLGLAGIAALLMFVYGGILWVTSGGKPEQVKKGKDTLIWAVIGIVVLFSAYALVSAVIGVLTGAGV